MSLLQGIVLLIIGVAFYIIGTYKVIPEPSALNRVLVAVGIILAIVGVIIIVLALLGYALLTGGILLLN